MANNYYTFTAEDILSLDGKTSQTKDKEEEKVSTPTTQTADTSRQSLLDELKEIEEKYSVGTLDYPDSLGLEKMTYTPKTDEEIKSLAEAELAEKKVTGENAIIADTDRQINDLNEYKSSEAKSAEEQLAEIEKLYEDRKSSAEKEALKRGLARSSIIMNMIDNFDQGKIDSEIKLNSELSDKLNKLDFSIASLTTAREKALDDFNIVLAAELTKKISELNAQRKASEEEVLKYNNSVTEKESKYLADKADAEQKALESYLKNKEEYDKLMGEEKLAAVKNYYDAMSPADALNDFLRDSFMQQELKEYYNYMLLYLKARSK